MTALAGAALIGVALAWPQPIVPSSTRGAAAEPIGTVPASSTAEPTPVPTTAPSLTEQPTAPPSPSPTVAVVQPSPAPALAAALGESEPTRVRIPDIGVDAATTELGLDGIQLETPDDPAEVGWFHGAHTPGGPGQAVLAGHVTWNGKNVVFARLAQLGMGQRIEIDRADGTTVNFEVSRIASYSKEEFPTDEVYAVTAEPSLVLITCGGEYDAQRHYYESNTIVWATLSVE